MDVPHLVPCPVCQTRMCTPGTYRCSVCVGKAPTPVQLSLGTCDGHSSARAVVQWERDAAEIRLCAHCDHHHRKLLREHGWTIGHTDLQAWQTQAPANA